MRNLPSGRFAYVAKTLQQNRVIRVVKSRLKRASLRNLTTFNPNLEDATIRTKTAMISADIFAIQVKGPLLQKNGSNACSRTSRLQYLVRNFRYLQ